MVTYEQRMHRKNLLAIMGWRNIGISLKMFSYWVEYKNKSELKNIGKLRSQYGLNRIRMIVISWKIHHWFLSYTRGVLSTTAQKMKLSIKDFFSKCNQICSFLKIWLHLPKKSLTKNFIFCAVVLRTHSNTAMIQRF